MRKLVITCAWSRHRHAGDGSCAPTIIPTTRCASSSASARAPRPIRRRACWRRNSAPRSGNNSSSRTSRAPAAISRLNMSRVRRRMATPSSWRPRAQTNYMGMTIHPTYDVVKDFEPIIRVAAVPNILVAHPLARRQQSEGADRAGENQAGRNFLRLVGRRHDDARGGRADQYHGRHQARARAVSRQRAGADRRAHRPHPVVVRAGFRRRPAGREGRTQGARRARRRSAPASRPTCRPWRRRGCPATTSACGSACSRPPARRRTSSTSLLASPGDALQDGRRRQGRCARSASTRSAAPRRISRATSTPRCKKATEVGHRREDQDVNLNLSAPATSGRRERARAISSPGTPLRACCGSSAAPPAAAAPPRRSAGRG